MRGDPGLLAHATANEGGARSTAILLLPAVCSAESYRRHHTQLNITIAEDRGRGAVPPSLHPSRLPQVDGRHLQDRTRHYPSTPHIIGRDLAVRTIDLASDTDYGKQDAIETCAWKAMYRSISRHVINLSSLRRSRAVATPLTSSV